MFINEVLFYGKVWGIARTAVNKCVLHRDHEFVSLIKDYLSRVRIREDELIEQQETSTHTSSNIEGTPLANPRKVVKEDQKLQVTKIPRILYYKKQAVRRNVDNTLADFVRSQVIT